MTLSMQIEQALKDAAQAHHAAVQTGMERDEDWPRFYAHFTACRLAPVLTMLVSGNASVEETLPSATVQAHFVAEHGTQDAPWRGPWDGGPSYQAQEATEYARSEYSRLHVG